MPKTELFSSSHDTFLFTRAKDTHKENDSTFITLFARLTKESPKINGMKVYKRIESVWVGIEEISEEQASKKIRALPNGIQKYTVTKEIFEEMVKLSTSCPDALHHITPIHMTATSKNSLNAKTSP